MIFPLEKLVEFNDNIYEITVAASRRAYQLAKINDEEVRENYGKVVCVAARQLFNKTVNYRIEEKNN
ncbi:MAG: DNA-directed RNA polymerase subunit omega [Treponema sp.]|nr:DNA-directed RNA polymerase subunit omega [Treponema sp.]